MQLSNPPRVSIVMPVYNGEVHLDEAVESVLAQDYRDFEFIIVDDGSSDRTPAMLAEWVKRDPRIVVLRNPKNLGIAAALNVGIDAARGEYIARQDADDVSLPHRLGLEVAHLDREPDVVLVSMNYEIIDERGDVIDFADVARPEVVIRWRFLFSNAIGGHGQVMFRRDVVRELGGYSVAMPWAEDYELWTRMLSRGRIVVLPQIGMRYRLHMNRSSEIWATEQQESGWRIAQDALQSLLRRDVREEEAIAVRHLWSLTLQPGRAKIADSVIRDAFHAFSASLQPREKALIRQRTAAQFVYVGALLFSKRAVAEALTHLRHGFAWDMKGGLQGLLQSLGAIRMWAWRRLR
ncbi:MAG TPA: glycosyltransferase family A protein [Thermoanaerobaculia bacterium]